MSVKLLGQARNLVAITLFFLLLFSSSPSFSTTLVTKTSVENAARSAANWLTLQQNEDGSWPVDGDESYYKSLSIASSVVVTLLDSYILLSLDSCAAAIFNATEMTIRILNETENLKEYELEDEQLYYSIFNTISVFLYAATNYEWSIDVEQYGTILVGFCESWIDKLLYQNHYLSQEEKNTSIIFVSLKLYALTEETQYIEKAIETANSIVEAQVQDGYIGENEDLQVQATWLGGLLNFIAMTEEGKDSKYLNSAQKLMEYLTNELGTKPDEDYVITQAVIFGLMELYKETQNTTLLEIAVAEGNRILTGQNNDGTWTIRGLKVLYPVTSLFTIYRETEKEEFKEVIFKTIQHLLENQKTSGNWDYAGSTQPSLIQTAFNLKTLVYTRTFVFKESLIPENLVIPIIIGVAASSIIIIIYLFRRFRGQFDFGDIKDSFQFNKPDLEYLKNQIRNGVNSLFKKKIKVDTFDPRKMPRYSLIQYSVAFISGLALHLLLFISSELVIRSAWNFYPYVGLLITVIIADALYLVVAGFVAYIFSWGFLSRFFDQDYRSNGIKYGLVISLTSLVITILISQIIGLVTLTIVSFLQVPVIIVLSYFAGRKLDS